MIRCPLETPIGTLSLLVSNDALVSISFSQRPEIPVGEHAVLAAAKEQLLEYFAGKRQTFDLPLYPQGTVFQLRVWTALREIPYGTTESYGALAARIGLPKAARAVGQANHCNPLPIVIPCHRVIGANGAIAGYAGGVDRQKKLLRIEGVMLP